MQNPQKMRNFMAYQARKRKPATPFTQVAHLIANRIILKAMQDKVFLMRLLEEYAETYEFTEIEVLGALKKIADTHRRTVRKNDESA